MTIRNIQHDASLEMLWEELVYTEERLRADHRVADLAPHFGDLIETWTAVNTTHLDACRAELAALASTDAAVAALEEATGAIAAALRALDRDPSSPHYRRYFTRPSGAAERFGLERDLERLRDCPAALDLEPEERLRDLGPRLEQALALGRAAVAERRRALSETADHRVLKVERLIDEVNARRRSIYTELLRREEQHAVGDDWPARFFRRPAPRAPTPVRREEERALVSCTQE